jgi:hypothetical protein
MGNMQRREQQRAVRVSRLAVVVACSIALSCPFEAAFATPASGFASSTIGPTQFDEIDIKVHADALKLKFETRGAADVYVVTNTVAPGGHSGWHTHPGPSLVTVKSGTATYYDGDDPTCTPHVILQGEGFVDHGDGHVHLVRNEDTVVLELVAFQIIPQGATRRIDAPSAGHCPF